MSPNPGRCLGSMPSQSAQTRARCRTDKKGERDGGVRLSRHGLRLFNTIGGQQSDPNM